MEWEYSNAKIKFSEQAKRFAVFFNGDDSGKAYDSWEQATAAILAREEREERQNRVKISVPVVDSKGNRHVISGVHGGHGGYLAKPPLDKYGSGPIYLEHPHVLELVDRVRKAESTLNLCKGDLSKFVLETSDYRRREDKLDTSEGIEAWRLRTVALAEKEAVDSKEIGKNP